MNGFVGEQLTIWALIKNSSYFIAFIASIEWLGFKPQIIAIFFVLMVMDIITALLRVTMNEGASEMKSAPLKRGLTAKFLLASGLFSMALATKGIGFDFQNIAGGMMNILILGELYSILGNVHSARTGQPKSEFDAVAYLLNKVKANLDKFIK